MLLTASSCNFPMILFLCDPQPHIILSDQKLMHTLQLVDNSAAATVHAMSTSHTCTLKLKL
ncbi:hypothetical protein GmHk_08G022917 [Glycine max]|nr:hypothetical protein GmHk_08G022917 [Glycine max]